MYGFYDTWTRPIWSGTRDQMKPTVPKNGICKWRRQNKSKAKLGRRKPCCSHNKSRQAEQLFGYMYIPIVITTTIDSWPTKLSQDCWPFCRWSVRQNVVFFLFFCFFCHVWGFCWAILYIRQKKRDKTAKSWTKLCGKLQCIEICAVWETDLIVNYVFLGVG